jgi:transcriptional regulator with XRE-family HTH domain
VATLIKKLGEVLRDERRAKGISQEAFADLIGMHRTQYGSIEQGRKDCQLTTLVRVAAGLEVPLWTLLRKAELDEQTESEIGHAST